MISNDDRRERASVTLEAWRQATSTGHPDGEDESNIRDAISDLLHLARAQGLNPREELDAAFSCFEDEDSDEEEDAPQASQVPQVDPRSPQVVQARDVSKRPGFRGGVT